jgi:RNA-directed DNA polymerase
MDDVLEVDHKVPRARGGSNMPHNRQLLHGHCHDVKTAKIDLGQ